MLVSSLHNLAGFVQQIKSDASNTLRFLDSAGSGTV